MRVAWCGHSSPRRVSHLNSPFRRLVIPSRHAFWPQLALGALLVASIAGAAKLSRPLYATRAPVATQIAEHRYLDSNAAAPDSSLAAVADSRAPWMSAPAEVALQTPAFYRDRDLFAMDLVRTGRVDADRARSLADVAVREAYTRKIPPALVLGVMLTENSQFKSSAKSNVGAVGLMQIEPKSWTRALGPKFGTNLRSDSTNLKYGIYILGWLAEKASHLVLDADDALRHALLSYNGCVKGANTPNCHTYPDVVKKNVVQSARSICGDQSFDQCVAEPMFASRRDPAAEETVAATK